MDRFFFGESPAVAFQWINIRWLNELLSFSYLSYHVYLHWLLWDAIATPESAINTMSRRVYGAFAVGLPMYLLLPAPSICYSFPELFTDSVNGYWGTRATLWIVANFAAKYDSFPSLHVFIMGTMVWFDPKRFGVRRKIMIPAYGLMIVSTILLRFHYGVDLLCGVVLLTIYVFIVSRRTANGEMA
ncbi:MAG: phosphatase PAP2 family protein [Planctomyces sp.]|nr:phosphatase PAP2 family protein [Planctomyces sp.]